MKIKRIILNCLFNKRQRSVLWEALLFSAHTYRRRKEMENFAVVNQVIEELKTVWGIKERMYSESEVAAIMKATSEKAVAKLAPQFKEEYRRHYEHGFKRGHDQALKELIDSVSPEGSLKVGTVIDTSVCKTCESKDSCETYNILRSEEEESKEEIKSKEKTEEQASEAASQADNKEEN